MSRWLCTKDATALRADKPLDHKDVNGRWQRSVARRSHRLWQDGPDGFLERVARVKAELAARARAIDHADVADEVELGHRERGRAEPPQRRQERPRERVREGEGGPLELLHDRR